ncbi:MAG: hypothetical protein AMXMBFR23_06570 [Chloroflexota bacterium]
MLTTAITFAASKKVIALAAASGVAASAMFAGNTTLQQEIRAMPAPILIEADLGSMLRLGGGSGSTAGVAAEAEVASDTAVSLGAEGSLLTEVNATLGVLEVAGDTTGAATTGASASAGTGLQVDLGLGTEASVEAEAVEATIVADAGGVLGVTLR